MKGVRSDGSVEPFLTSIRLFNPVCALLITHIVILNFGSSRDGFGSDFSGAETGNIFVIRSSSLQGPLQSSHPLRLLIYTHQLSLAINVDTINA